MTFKEYLKVDAVNASALKEILHSPLHGQYKYFGPDRIIEESESFDIGTALHSLILDGEKVWITKPKFNKRTIKGKEDHAKWKAALPEDAIALTKDDGEMVEAMADSILSHDEALEYITPNQDVFKTENNVIFDYDHRGTIVKAKSRLDLIKVKNGEFPDFETVMTVVDVKTAADASPKAFQRDIANYKYYVQAAFYLTAAASVCKIMGPYKQVFKFLVVEKKPPYAVAVIGLKEEAMKQGFRKVDEAMDIYCAYKDQKDPWPGYRMPDQGELELDLPVYERDILYRPDLVI